MKNSTKTQIVGISIVSENTKEKKQSYFRESFGKYGFELLDIMKKHDITPTAECIRVQKILEKKWRNKWRKTNK